MPQSGRAAVGSRDRGRTVRGRRSGASVASVDAAPAPVLEVLGACVQFGAGTVLDAVDLRIGPGEAVALLGGEGSGRSTLCRVLNRTEALTDGEVRLDGRTVPSAGTALAVLRADVGLVPPHAYLTSGRTLLDECATGPARVRGLDRDQARARAIDALTRVDLADRQDAQTSALAPGQRQRGALARALALDPLVLLLDDPTADLDPAEAAAFHAAVRALRNDASPTIVMVERDLDAVRAIAGRVVVLDAGRIVEDVDAATFFAGPASDAGRRCLGVTGTT